jgi:uncharacterized membrane protein
MPQASAPPLWRLAGTGAALAAYAVVSHLLMVHAPDRPWSVAALFGPLWAAIALSGWLRRHGPTLAGCALAAGIVIAVVARGGVEDIHLMYVLQHGGIHAALAWMFGRTLYGSRVPLITAVAERVHASMTAPMRAYTRGVTLLWAAYFVGMIVVSALLYGLAPWPWWSLFCNVITPLAVIVLFVGEHAWRRWRHPHFERVSLLRALHAYRQRQGEGDAGGATAPQGVPQAAQAPATPAMRDGAVR